MSKTIRLSVSILCVILLFTLSLSAPASAVDNAISPLYKNSVYYKKLSNVVLTGNYRDDVITVAKSQIGYHEGDSEADYGGDNLMGNYDFTEYGRYLDSVGRVWCSEFATWCIRVAGVPTDIVNNSNSARAKRYCLNSTAKYYSWDETVYRGGEYTPQKGDLILWVWSTYTGVVSDDDSLSHTAIIEDVTENEDGSVTFLVVHGNATNNVTETIYTVDKENGHTVTPVYDDIVESGTRQDLFKEFDEVSDEESDSFVANSKGYIGYFVAPDYEKELKSTGTITFDSNGGEAVFDSKTIAKNGIIGVLPEATKEDCELLGWFTEKDGGQEVNIYTPCAEPLDRTLYAHWAAAPPKPVPTVILGDVDRDEKVTIIDATAIQRYLASIPTTTYNEEAADVDGDDSVTILDATCIQRHLANLPTQTIGIGEPIK